MVAFTAVDGPTAPPIARRADGSNTAAHFAVTPRFFSTLRAQLRGRDIEPSDSAGAPWVAVINETAARLFWPRGDALGKRVLVGNSPDERPREIVGIIRDIPLRMNDQRERAAVYTPYDQRPGRHALSSAALSTRMIYLVRTEGDPTQRLPLIREMVARIDPDRPLGNVSRMDAQVDAGIPARAISAATLVMFAASAALLAAIGIYGVLAYTAAQRMPEIGVRLALGARRHEAIAVVCRQAVRLTAIGIVVGSVGALAASRLVASQLWNVTTTDLPSYVTAAFVVLLTAALASAIPARKVLRASLVESLRGQ
jgi:hypothetical protein